jgi:hypothetical protein
MNTEIKDYMNYEFPSIMETTPELIEAIIIDYFDDVKSINGLGFAGDEPCEDMMCYVQDRLINEKWEQDECDIIDNIEEVLVNHFDEVLASSSSTKDLYQTLWEIYEDEYDADEDRDGQIFDDMVADAIEYGICK